LNFEHTHHHFQLLNWPIFLASLLCLILWVQRTTNQPHCSSTDRCNLLLLLM